MPSASRSRRAVRSDTSSSSATSAAVTWPRACSSNRMATRRSARIGVHCRPQTGQGMACFAQEIPHLPTVRAVIRGARASTVLGCLLAGVGGVVALSLGWRGADWPAQLYRVDLFRRVGFTQWDNQWYGGHHTPGYSLLLPPLGAVFGVRAVGIASGVVATAGFAALVRRRIPAPALAAVVFGIGTVSNLVVGRITFALGLAI